MTRQGLRSIFFVLGPQSVTVKIDTLGPVTAGKAASGRADRSITLAYGITDGLSSDATAICIIVKNSEGTTVKTLRPDRQGDRDPVRCQLDARRGSAQAA
jgi:hypothetical protein